MQGSLFAPYDVQEPYFIAISGFIGITDIKFVHVKHPKSFVSLHPADHMLSNKDDSMFVAEIVSAWA